MGGSFAVVAEDKRCGTGRLQNDATPRHSTESWAGSIATSDGVKKVFAQPRNYCSARQRPRRWTSAGVRRLRTRHAVVGADECA